MFKAKQGRKKVLLINFTMETDARSLYLIGSFPKKQEKIYMVLLNERITSVWLSFGNFEPKNVCN